MSCWCDGEDPGCETCHPEMLPEARQAFRTQKVAERVLIRIALHRETTDVWTATLVAAADAYRTASEEASVFDAFGRRK